MRRPLWIPLLVGSLAGANLTGLIGSLQDGVLYTTLNLPFSAAFIAIYTGVWAVLFALILFHLLRWKAWAFRWTAPLLTLYSAAGLLRVLLFVRSDYDQGRLGFLLMSSILFLAPVWWVVVRNGWLKRY